MNQHLLLNCLLTIILATTILFTISPIKKKKNQEELQELEKISSLLTQQEKDILHWAFLAAEIALPLPPEKPEIGPDPFQNYRQKRITYQREINHILEKSRENPLLTTLEKLAKSLEFHKELLTEFQKQNLIHINP